MKPTAPVIDVVSIAVCTLAWGTTWYAITWQLGSVDPIISLVYRFGLASALLFLWCAVRRERISLTRLQHFAAFGVGAFTFAFDYAFVYWAEEKVTSAVVAVMFAALALLNLVAFRLAFGQRAPRSAWIAASLGALGVLVLSWTELTQSQMSDRTLTGILMAFAAVIGASFGNVYARRGEEAGASVAGSTAWGMAYGTVLLVLYAELTQRPWTFDARMPYFLSLLYLAVVGSVIAFLLYYGLARRRGYATASYISALTPPLAMAMSALFENKRWGIGAMSGVGLVVLGQWMLLKGRKA